MFTSPTYGHDENADKTLRRSLPCRGLYPSKLMCRQYQKKTIIKQKAFSSINSHVNLFFLF